MMSVDVTIPSVASVEIAQRRLISASRSTCSAPAKRRKLKSPFIRVSSNSTSVSTWRTTVWRPRAGNATSASKIATETARAMTTSPIVWGSRSQRWLMYPKSAASVTRSATRLKMLATVRGHLLVLRRGVRLGFSSPVSLVPS